jgi:hypothetical protein
MLRKINGWMRIWIVLSALFFIVSLIYGIRDYNIRNYQISQIYMTSCELNNPSIESKKGCEEYAKKKTDESKKAEGGILVQVLIFSIIPLSLIWLFGFISYRIFMWIKKGFEN